jgi:hypothetical protein
MTEQDILKLIHEDRWMISVLEYARTLDLPQWMISAGFVRNKVWNHLNHRQVEHSTDIDLIYFDPGGNGEQQDQELTRRISSETGWNWEVVNQAYTHDWNAEEPYVSAEDALAHFPETATAIAVALERDELMLVAPYGIDDLINMIVRPTPAFMTLESRRNSVRERIEQKQRRRRWPNLTVASF